MNLGEKCESYLLELASITERREGLTRLYLTKEHKRALKTIQGWMEEVGLKTIVDDAGNLIGSHFCKDKNQPTLIMGSHQDSVINGGIYDGMLGVVAPIIALHEIDLNSLSYNLKIVAFGDEEGVRFKTTYLGSKALTGNFSDELLNIKDENDIALKEALKIFGLNPANISESKLVEEKLSYVEVHIEQGPVLEKENTSVGIVKAINAFQRYEITIDGKAGHAGTTPMNMRQDAGVVMAETAVFIKEIAEQTDGLVATIGQASLKPGAINVIPDQSVFSLDIRAPEEIIIDRAIGKIKEKMKAVSYECGVTYQMKRLARGDACICNENIINLIKSSVEENKIKPVYLNSGAGHDAQEMSNIANVGMLFVRCKEGISHHPDEYVKITDLESSVNVVQSILKNYNKG